MDEKVTGDLKKVTMQGYRSSTCLAGGGTLVKEDGEILYLEHLSKYSWSVERIQGSGCGYQWNNSSDQTGVTNEGCSGSQGLARSITPFLHQGQHVASPSYQTLTPRM